MFTRVAVQTGRYVVDQPYGPRTNQGGVEKLTNNADTNGQLTYLLNGKATEPEDVVWYQKLGEDDRPMLTSRGGDIVYAYMEGSHEYYTNDGEMSSFDFYGPLLVMRDQTQAFLDGNSTQNLTLNKEIWVGNVELDREVQANVPSTIVLPFSANVAGAPVKFYTFDGWYDLNGNRVEEDYQGIRVSGNKKVIVK